MTTNTEELKKLAQAATPGQWFSNHHGVFKDEASWADGSGRICNVSCTTGWYESEKANRDFIAAVNPAAILELIDLYDTLLAAAELAVSRMKDTGDSVSINALEKAIKGVKG